MRIRNIGSIILVVWLCVHISEAQVSRIVGGTATTIDAVSYLVRVKIGAGGLCGGTLVGKRWVVSAAHCFVNQKAVDIKVIAGSSYLNRGGVTKKVTKIYVPASYDRNSQNNDIAVLKLDSDFVTSKDINPIPLFSGAELKAGVSVKVSGWGTTSENGNVAEQVRTVDVLIVDKKKCSARYGSNSIKNSMFCASKPGKDSCQGDSGGPVVKDNKLYGVVSWGAGCARKDYPGVYSYILDPVINKFIKDSMKN